MPDLQRIRKFEDRLKRLKAQRDANEITGAEYADQAEALRFADTAAGQEWWLDPEDEQWYLAPTGSEDFELADPQPGATATTPPLITPEAKVETPLIEPSSRSEEKKPSFPVKEPQQPPQAEKEESTSQESPPLTERRPSPKLIIGGVIGGFILAALLCVISWQPVSTLIGGAITPTPANTAAQLALSPSPSPTPPPTKTYTPLPIHTSTLAPNATLTATKPPPATLTLTNTLPAPIPTDTPTPPTPTPIPTDAPTPPTPTSTPTEESQPIFSGKLAYSYFDPAKQTYIIEIIELPDTANPIFAIEQASQPALTSDGSRLAYHSWDSRGVTSAKGIGMFHISLDNPNILNKISQYQEAHRPQWGPNDKDKAFSFIQTDGEEVRQIRFSDEGGMPFTGFAESAAWTPDGSRLVFYACQGTQCGLAIANTNGAGFEFLTDGADYRSPAVSPNGDKIAYTAKTDDNWDVWVMNIDGSNQQRLTIQSGKDGIPTWSPNGNYIAYASQQNGQWEIRVIDPDGSSDQQLFVLPGSLEGKVPEIPDHAQPGWLYESLSWTQ